MCAKRFIVLENGSVLEGEGFGYEGEACGELVFTTGMTGYIETLTDPSYMGQIIMQTFPLIGNVGLIEEDCESNDIYAVGYVVRELTDEPSNFRCGITLDEWLKRKKIPGVKGVDTRALTRMIRRKGTMNAVITDDPKKVDIKALSLHRLHDEVSRVSTKEAYEVGEGGLRVALLDFGMKGNILRELNKRNVKVKVFPYNTKPEEIIKYEPSGIMLSNGPGDPKDNVEVIENLKVLNQYMIPTFGICLGHQLLALSMGFETSKLTFGHRGLNQPVREVGSDRVYITSQNHGYEVLSKSIDEEIAWESFVNVNDGSCEGIEYEKAPFFSVQFHPEACAGPHDTGYLFDRFVELMEVRK